MSVFEQLAEARIREWLARPAAERDAVIPADPAIPLEVQLQADITALDRMARQTPIAADAAAMRKRADETMVRLMILLESQGRPLAARHFQDQRQR